MKRELLDGVVTSRGLDKFGNLIVEELKEKFPSQTFNGFVRQYQGKGFGHLQQYDIIAKRGRFSFSRVIASVIPLKAASEGTGSAQATHYDVRFISGAYVSPIKEILEEIVN